MKGLFLFAFTCVMLFTTKACEASILTPVDTSSLEGKWDLTLLADGKAQPSWLEVRHSGHHTFVGQFVAIVGSARPISRVIIDGNRFRFSIPPQWEDGAHDLVFEGTFDKRAIKGTIMFPDGKTYECTGVRAPFLPERENISWGKPRALIQKNDLKGWSALGDNQWVVENGVLRSPKSGSNLMTVEKFNDFKLHVEFRYPKGSNSGIYLRGRYEVQIMDDNKKEPSSEEFGGVYGFITPLAQVAKGPGEWQTYDITLVGRVLTVVANGVTIISNQAIPGITGGALDSKEGESGPILLQGDHGPIEYRNIIITLAE
jgi:hypothetical protein